MTTQTRLPEDFKAAYEYHKSQGDFIKAKRVADLYRQQLAGQPQPTQQQTIAPLAGQPQPTQQQTIAPPVAVADRDNALQFSVDQLQKTGGNLIEFAGRATGMPSIEQYGRDVIEQQETDIAEGGYQSSYADPLKDYIQRGDYGTFAKALGTKMAENAASVGVAPATVAAATGAAVYGAPAAVIAGLSTLGTAATVGLGIGEAVGEQKDKLGDFNTATAGATGLLIGLLDRVGAKGILKADTLANMSLKDIAKVLKDKGPAGSAKKFLRAFRDEFLTEGAQESTLIGATALQGGQYTGDEVLGRVSDASLIGGATGGSIRGAVDATNAAKSGLSGVLQKAQKLQFNKPQKVEDLGEITEGNFIEAPAVGRGRDQKIATEDKFSDIEREKVATARGAKGAMARRLIDKVVLDEYDLTDVATASTSGARSAIDSIHKDLVSALKLSAGNIKKTYKETLAKDELSVLEKVTSKAQNKTKNVVDNSDISEVLDILGNTPEAVDFINLALQLNEVTILHNAGYIGGVSKLTDQFLPFTDVTGINYNPQRQTPTVTNTAAQFVTSPIGITGRAIDKITGRRFPLQRYMEQNKNAPGLPLPERGGKVALAIAAQERENQQTDRFNRATDSLLAEQLSSDDAIMGSPRDIFGRGTGLKLPDIISTLENLSAEAQDADVKALYDANVVALRTGTESAPNMSAVIAQVRRRIAQDPALQALQIAPAEATGARANLQQNQTAGQALTSQANINYERGVQANRDRAKSLQEQLMADKAISASDKALIGAKLDELQYGNLGVRPLESLNSMLRSLKESNVSIEAVDNYFMPAAMAIGKQQKNAPKPADDSELALSYTPPKRSKSGKYIGAPTGMDTSSKLQRLRKSMQSLAEQGEYGRFWYEYSGKAILEITDGNIDDARKLISAIAITSPQTGVDTNFEFALQAYYQWKNGQPIRTGIFPTSMSEKLEDVFAGKTFTGRKIGNFENNLLRTIDPELTQGVTTDIWIMRAFGYNQDAPTDLNYDFVENEIQKIARDLGWEPQQVQAAIWVEIKSRQENPSVKAATDKLSEQKGYIKFVPNKKGKLVREFQDLSNATNPKEKRKGILKSEQAHNRIWLEKALRYDPDETDRNRAKFDYSDAAAQKILQVSVETIPSTKSSHFPEIFSASEGEIIEYHHAMNKALLDDRGMDIVAQRLGILNYGFSSGVGAWEGRTDPVSQSLIVAPKQYKEDGTISDDAKILIEAYAAIKGILFKQDGIGYHKPFFKGMKVADMNGSDINIGRPLSVSETLALHELITAQIPAEVNSNNISLVSSPEGVRVLNFTKYDENVLPNYTRKKADPSFQKIVLNALSDITFDNGETCTHSRFTSDGNLLQNKWNGGQTNGEGYYQDRFKGRPDLQRTIEDVLRELFPRVRTVEEDFSRRYGWTANKGLNAKFDPDRQAEELAESLQSPVVSQPQGVPALAPFTPRAPPSIPSIPKPTVGEVKEQLPEADAKFSIGKKGSKYENGLPTFDDAKRFIAELGYSLNLYQNFDAFNRDMKAMSGEERDRMTTKGSFARRTGTILINPMQGNLERFLTVLHETGHGLGKTNTNSNLFMPMLEEGSFESLVENNSKIQNEMAAIQRDEYRRELSDGRTVRQDVRSGIDMAVSGSMTIEEAMQLSDYQEYAATNTERVADAFAFYLFDPKRMKSNYPATAKEIQNYFKRLQKRDPSMPVTFQANPLTVILAAVMAGVAQMAAQDDEEKENRPQPGALTPSVGALSA